eukprot:scaffold503_cov375-Pinguiococcus_pyrenoidosus.AAC.21
MPRRCPPWPSPSLSGTRCPLQASVRLLPPGRKSLRSDGPTPSKSLRLTAYKMPPCGILLTDNRAPALGERCVNYFLDSRAGAHGEHAFVVHGYAVHVAETQDQAVGNR